MRTGLPGLVVLSALLGASFAGHTASAQVTVNPGALDLLPAAPRAAAPRPAPRPHPAPGRAGATGGRTASGSAAGAGAGVGVGVGVGAPGGAPPRTGTGAAATAATAAASTAPPAKPVLPTVPPAIAALPPPAPVPPPRPQPPPVMHVEADAVGAASPLPGGVRVTFGKDSQDLNPKTAAALAEIAGRLRANELATVNLFAYAEGTQEDPSTARRLALARALTARAVLIKEGVASARIYPRSMPPADGDVERDRVDVVVTMPSPAGASPAGASAGGSPATPASASR